jgi:hypothetical protein
MRLPRALPVEPPTVDELAFRDLYRKSLYEWKRPTGGRWS